MQHRKTEDTMFLLGGALLGAAAMYLLDPDAGRRRRERIAERTSDAIGAAGESIAPVWEKISDRTRDWADRAKEYGSGIADRARDAGSSLSDRAEDARDSAADYGSDLWGRVRGWGKGWARDAGRFGSSIGSSIGRR